MLPFIVEFVSYELGNMLLLELTDEAVVGGADVSMRLPSARSSLFPTRRSVRFGLARARASARNGGSWLKVLWFVRSYTNIAPAAPR